MISEEIRLVPELTGQTTSGESELKLRNGYFVYTSSFGGNLVNEFTVRDFLDNVNYEELATKFFNYLKDNFTKPDFTEIYYSNVKLANVFNDFYDKTVRSNLPPTTQVAKEQLVSTTAVTYTNTNFLDYNRRSEELLTDVIGYTTGDSYYITVPISRSYNILDNPNYDKYRRDSLGTFETKQIAEQFRYVIRKNSTTINEKGVVHLNSFDDYSALTPVPLNVTTLKIQFKNDKYIIPNNAQPSIIPVEIVFDKPSEISGQTFQLRIENAIGGMGDNPLGAYAAGLVLQNGGQDFLNPPSIGTEIGLVDGENDNLTSQNFLISYGQSSVTANIAIKSPRIFLMKKLDITLKLLAGTNLNYNENKSTQAYTVSDEKFHIIAEQDVEVEHLQNESIDYVIKFNKTTPKVFLQSFVDYNFDDNESLFWLNPPTTGFPPEFTIASAPTPPAPPAPTEHGNIDVFGAVDLTTNSLYNQMIAFGYQLIKREGLTDSIVTMNGNTGQAMARFFLFGGPNSTLGQIKQTEFAILGYNNIKFDVTDQNETNRIKALLKQFFLGAYFH